MLTTNPLPPCSIRPRGERWSCVLVLVVSPCCPAFASHFGLTTGECASPYPGECGGRTTVPASRQERRRPSPFQQPRDTTPVETVPLGPVSTGLQPGVDVFPITPYREGGDKSPVSAGVDIYLEPVLSLCNSEAGSPVLLPRSSRGPHSWRRPSDHGRSDKRPRFPSSQIEYTGCLRWGTATSYALLADESGRPPSFSWRLSV